MQRLSTSAIAASTGLVCLLTAGCGTGTDLNQIVNVDPHADGAGAASGGGQGGSFQDPFAGAPGYVAQRGGGGAHNAGLSCMESGCHGSVGAGGGGEGPTFLIGGTVYSDYKGSSPAAGVEIRIVDSAGHAASTYSGSNGNFYIGGNANGVTFPAIVGARDGSTSRPMITPLNAMMGSCGQQSCHVPGGGPTTNTHDYYPIHVP
jgi:hypothetical protein